METNSVVKMITDKGYEVEMVREYLTAVRKTGEVNMFFASGILTEAFEKFSRKEAFDVCAEYTRNGLKQ